MTGGDGTTARTRPHGDGGPVRAGLPLLERAREQEVLSAALAGLGAGRPALVTVKGSPGEGQNDLLRWAARLAADRGLQVLHARATPTERELRYGAVHQLLTPLSGVIGESLRAMAEQQQPGALPGLAEVLRSAPGTPTLLVVEDVQWLDAASQEWLQALMRRLRTDVPIALAASSGHPTDSWNWLTGAAPAAVHVTNLVMRTLSREGVATAVRLVCGTQGDAYFNAAVAEATSGNPAVLGEVLRRFHGRGHEPAAARLPELRSISDGIVSDRATRTLDGLPAEATAVMRALAVCGDLLDFSLVRTLAGPAALPEPELRAMLESAGLIVTEGTAARVRHSSVKTRVLERMPGCERAALHISAAALAHRAAVNDEDVADILFRAPAIGAPWVVETLRRSAADALAAGDHRHATDCLVRALREPLDPAERAVLDLELAEAEIVATPEAGDRRLANLARFDAGRPASVPLRAIDLGLARGNQDWACRAAAEALPAARGDAYHDLIALHWLAHRDRPDETELMLPVVPALPDVPVTPAQAGVRAWQLATRAEDLETTRAFARQCLNAAPREGGAGFMPRLAACRALYVAAASDEAQAGLDSLLTEARRDHNRAAAAVLLTMRAEINLRGGRLDAAERDVEAAEHALPLASWHPLAAPQLAATGVCVAVESGRYDLARRLARTALPEGAEDGVAWCHLLFARAQVASLDEQWREVLRLSRECGRMLLRHRWLNPAVLPWRAMAAHALSMIGGHEEAELLVREELALAERWGTASAVGLVMMIAGPKAGDAPAARLREAAQIFAAAPDRLLHAWSLVELATAELQAGNPRTAAGLVAGLTRLSTTYPSSRMAEAVRRLTEELERPAILSAAAPPVRTTLAPPVRAVLSAVEWETAALAGRGHGNREIAHQLSVSTRAVELRLSSVYRKLYITGRKELRALVQAGEGRPKDAA